MKITYNGVTYELTAPQAQALRAAAMLPSGAFCMDRRNDATEAKLAGMGLLVEDYIYRDPEERMIKRDSVLLDLESAANYARIGHYSQAREKAGEAYHQLIALERTRHYLTEAGYAVVLRMPGAPTAFVPARFRHLLPEVTCDTCGRIGCGVNHAEELNEAR